MTLKESVERYILGFRGRKSKEKCCNNIIFSKIFFSKWKKIDKLMAGWNENSLGRAFVKLPVLDQILNTWNLLLYYSVLPKFFLNMDSAIFKYIYI